MWTSNGRTHYATFTNPSSSPSNMTARPWPLTDTNLCCVVTGGKVLHRWTRLVFFSLVSSAWVNVTLKSGRIRVIRSSSWGISFTSRTRTSKRGRRLCSSERSTSRRHAKWLQSLLCFSHSDFVCRRFTPPKKKKKEKNIKEACKQSLVPWQKLVRGK